MTLNVSAYLYRTKPKALTMTDDDFAYAVCSLSSGKIGR